MRFMQFARLRARLIGLAGAAAAALSFTSAAQAQYVMMPDSTNDRIVLFSPVDGSLVNSNYFGINDGTTPVHAMQVGSEIWVSEQLGDSISRYSLTGSPLGTITGGLDNVRGMGLIGGSVYVTNSGTNNGAPGNAVIEFDTAGNNLGSFSTVGLAPSPFGILEYQGGMLVSSSSANDDIHEFSLAGGSLGTFHNSASLNFAEQMDYAADGNILVAGFSTNNVVKLDANTGALISSFAASGARGVYQLGNGNILWTSGSGTFVFDTATGGTTQVYAGGGRYLDNLVIPEPGSAALLGAAGLLALRRRR